jgi:hypothetical protein
MRDDPEDYPRLSYQRLLEIRAQLSWIRELLQMMFLLGAVWLLRSEHSSWIAWIVASVVLVGLLWLLDRKYER